jgi:N-acetylneuraminic acid mutarotase
LVDCAHDDWTWINGTSTAGTNQTPQYGSFPATAPTTPPNPYTNTPGGRDSAATWTDAAGNLWLFGGQGYELGGGTTPDTQSGVLNDLWECQMTGDYCQWQLLEAPVSGKFPIAQSENVAGSYGTLGSAATTNFPGGRWGAATWTDAAGNFWLFGGQGIDSTGASGMLGDLWEYNPLTSEWTWMGLNGSQFVSQRGAYTGGAGTLTPGARWASVAWTDKAGNFWLFGGLGFDVLGKLGFLNDLWKYNTTTNQWTWVSASLPTSDLINQNGVYGAPSTPAATNTPGGRQSAVGWVDAAGNLWLFGGEGEDSAGTANGILNDLWEYNIANNQWTFVMGSSLVATPQDGVYGGALPSIGPVNTASAAGTTGLLSPTPGALLPGSRRGSTAWTDANGNLWLFGGWGLDATGANGNGFLNDLWSYTPSSNPVNPGTWTWIKGSDTTNQNGSYGTLKRPYFTNVNWTPGGRTGAVKWVDSQGELWLFGGQGYDSTSTTGNGYLNDLWRYLPYP